MTIQKTLVFYHPIVDNWSSKPLNTDQEIIINPQFTAHVEGEIFIFSLHAFMRSLAASHFAQ